MGEFGGQEKSLTEKTADAVISYIFRQGLEPDAKLPNEYVLAEELQVGRSTIREAMKFLSSRNIVDIRQGSGTYVSKKQGVAEDPLGLIFIQDNAVVAKDLLEIRFLIEPSIASMAAQKATPQEIHRIKELCDITERLIREGGDYTGKDGEFHTAIALASGNTIMPRLIPIFNRGIETLVGVSAAAELSEETIAIHRDIVEAIAIGDGMAARDAMHWHLIYAKRMLARANIG